MWGKILDVVVVIWALSLLIVFAGVVGEWAGIDWLWTIGVWAMIPLLVLLVPAGIWFELDDHKKGVHQSVKDRPFWWVTGTVFVVAGVICPDYPPGVSDYEGAIAGGVILVLACARQGLAEWLRSRAPVPDESSAPD